MPKQSFLQQDKKGDPLFSMVGNTPLVPIRSLDGVPSKVHIYAKLEEYNPSGSVKARAAANIILKAEQDGLLAPGGVLLDASSGNTGIAYAMFAAARGYTLKICLPKNANQERKSLLKAFGAEIIYTSPLEGSDGAIIRARELAQENPDWFYCDQYSNDANWKAHYQGTGPEIWNQTEGTVTHFVSSLGTSGTFMGCARFFHEHHPHVCCIAVQPDSPFHGLEGMKHMESAMVPSIYREDEADRHMEAPTEEAFSLMRRMAREHGFLVGPSCAGALWGALQVAQELEEGVIVVIFPDSGERYTSEPHLWEGE